MDAALASSAGAEDELKCAAVLAFIQNARWTAPLPASVPLTVGVYGRPAFLHLLSGALEGKSVDGRPLRVIDLKPPVDPHCCQVVYLATDKGPEIKPVLLALGPVHVLTVGESEGFIESGGAVNLFLSDGHMAFEASLDALDHAGVEISSRLLRFGVIRDLAKGRRTK